MLELFSTYGFEVVMIILLVGIPLIIKAIKSVKATWQQREAFIQENIEKGKKIEAEEEADILQRAADEARIKAMEDNIKLLTSIAQQQKEQIDLLLKSDKLNIKAWIKAQHDFWVPRKCIDSQILDLLEERYEIYQKENGNSWAKKMMDDLRELPVITVVPPDTQP